MGKKMKFKKGVASFYIVAFSTLILVIVAASFATVIISEVTRTSNDDLSQSAYDSALAGVEDAKLAYANYRRCLAEGTTLPAGYTPDLANNTVSCQDIVYWMENPNCDMVGHMTGRLGKSENGEVAVSDTVYVDGENAVTSDLNQAYTCVTIDTTLDDYRATLTSANQLRVVKAEFEAPASAAKVKVVKLSWYSPKEDVGYCYSNVLGSAGTGCSRLGSGSGWRVAFQPTAAAQVAAPPTVEVQLVQTASRFTLSDFDISSGNQTDRATVYLVPTNDATAARGSKDKNYTGIWNGSENVLSAAQIASTNNRQVSNVPYVVFCEPNSTADFLCSVTLNLPEPVNASTSNPRNNDTFMLAVSLPYGQPDTDFAVEFWCDSGLTVPCSDKVESTTGRSLAFVSSSQVSIDSTGRANDLFRRVEVRLESANTSFAYPEYAIQILGNTTSSDVVVSKDLTVRKEYNFYK